MLKAKFNRVRSEPKSVLLGSSINFNMTNSPVNGGQCVPAQEQTVLSNKKN